MNNKLTQQQAWETLEWYLNMMQVLDESMTLEGMELTVRDLLAALDDTGREATNEESHEGFSNRETWATYVHITNTPSWLADLYDKETGDGIKAWFDNCFEELLAMGDEDTVRAALDIGSLWRVNWDEVADALRGGEG